MNAEELEEFVANRDIQFFTEVTKDGVDGDMVLRPYVTKDQKSKICSIVWHSGMVRYFDPLVASPNAWDSSRPLTSLENIQLMLSIEQLSFETGSVAHNIFNAVLGCYSLINRGYGTARNVCTFALDKFRQLFLLLTSLIFFAGPASEVEGGEEPIEGDDGEEPIEKPKKLFNVEIDMYAALHRHRCASGVRRIRRDDEDWVICTAVLGSAMMRYLKRSITSSDAPLLNQPLPFNQTVQLLNISKQIREGHQKLFHEPLVQFTTNSSSVMWNDNIRNFKNGLLELFRALWLIAEGPFELLLSSGRRLSRIVTWR